MEVIRCYSCGTPLSQYYDLFILLREIKTKKITEENDVDISNVLLENLKIKCDDIYETIGIYNWCCRGRLTSAKRFNEYIESVIQGNE